MTILRETSNGTTVRCCNQAFAISYVALGCLHMRSRRLGSTSNSRTNVLWGRCHYRHKIFTKLTLTSWKFKLPLTFGNFVHLLTVAVALYCLSAIVTFMVHRKRRKQIKHTVPRGRLHCILVDGSAFDLVSGSSNDRKARNRRGR